MMSNPKKAWVREASLNRLNTIFQGQGQGEPLSLLFKGNKGNSEVGGGQRSDQHHQHQPTNEGNYAGNQRLTKSVLNVDLLEDSGLSVSEKDYLEVWYNGGMSGRHCMVAMLDYRLNGDSQSSEENSIQYLSAGVVPRPMEFSMLSSTFNLPEHFLCDSGFLYEKVFSRPPIVVTNDAIATLLSKAIDTGDTIRVDQLNLAIKQLKIDHLCTVDDSATSKSTSSDENTEHNAGLNSSPATSQNQSIETKRYHVSLLIELVRIHILANTSNDCDDSSSLSQRRRQKKLSTSESAKSAPETMDANEELLVIEPKQNAIQSTIINPKYLVHHLDTPLTKVAEDAALLKPEELESGNHVLKSYIRQLSTLKASLTNNLRDLEDTKAYIALGVQKDATEGDIKKAYHSKAIKLHPDKPGGDTALFQQLQANYQEIMNKRKSDSLQSSLSEGLEANPKVREESQQARKILSDMAESLDIIKQSADKCTHLAQLAIQWGKLVERDSKIEFPLGLEALHTLISDGEMVQGLKKSKKSKSGKAKAMLLTVQSLSPEQAASLLETVCDQMQRLASLAMKLPSCGFRYGLCTAVHGSFMKNVESTMTSGLGVMKLMSTLLGAGEQVASCLRKVSESRLQAARNQQIHNILVEMVSTAFQSLSGSIGQAADVCVEAAVTAADLYRSAASVIDMGEKEAVEEARREAENKEKESAMCAEDREFMAEKRRRDREELGKQAEKQFEEEVKKEEEEEKARKEENVEQLRVKIKSLQVQLRVQHVQALQSMNREARQIQKQLQVQLRDMITTGAFRTDITEAQWKEMKRLEKASGGRTDGKPNDAKRSPPLRLSLLSLLADFIDCACNALREELKDVTIVTTSPDSIAQLLRAHLGWMQVIGNQKKPIEPPVSSIQEPVADCAKDLDMPNPIDQRSGSSRPIDDIDGDFDEIRLEFETQESHSNAEADKESKGSQSAKAESTCPDESPRQDSTASARHTFAGIQLALLPDYRSKTLWMCSVVDPETVTGMVRHEVVPRVVDDIYRKYNQVPSSNDVKGSIEAVTKEYFDRVCEGVFHASAELESQRQW